MVEAATWRNGATADEGYQYGLEEWALTWLDGIDFRNLLDLCGLHHLRLWSFPYQFMFADRDVDRR
ncbi:MAG: hypothetical protein OXH49_02795, partial [Gemmatimonadetes bacterium]|nr:hypothetical protein [Gemmatimonadota bacterium]